MLGISDSEAFNEKFEVHTLTEVLAEIRDHNARLFLQSLPYELKVHTGEEKICK